MPKEQGHFGERAARSTSKTAKDKSNSATLRASQGGTHREPSGIGDMSNRMLRCESEKDSEKDSGYSGEQRSIWMFGYRLHEYPTGGGVYALCLLHVVYLSPILSSSSYTWFSLFLRGWLRLCAHWCRRPAQQCERTSQGKQQKLEQQHQQCECCRPQHASLWGAHPHLHHQKSGGQAGEIFSYT